MSKEKENKDKVSDNLTFVEKMIIVFQDAWKNLRNKNVPSKIKAIYVLYIILEVAYIVSPIDILPECILPFLGFADDMAMLPLIMHTLNRFNKRSEKHLQLPSPKEVEQLPPHNPPEKEEAPDD